MHLSAAPAAAALENAGIHLPIATAMQGARSQAARAISWLGGVSAKAPVSR
jgi:hypothetical protein